MNNENFFNESREQSCVKAAIVSKYFDAWANVIIPWAKKGRNHVAYIDLFAGPGRYDDGTKSTPLMILEKAINHSDLREMLVTVFNDLDGNHTRSLETEISGLQGIEGLKHKPRVYNKEVGTEVVKMFEQMTLVPTLFFVDPWGYKGLSLRLVNSVLKDWGCDCIFFFNYNRINMGVSNDAVKDHMDALFGPERAAKLRVRLEGLDADARELVVVEELAQALTDLGGKFVLPFRFRSDTGSRTSHHLVFVSKNIRGYAIMKDIMARESSKVEQGVPSFEYNPADRRCPLLFELARPLDELEDMLLVEFACRTVTMKQVFEGHNVGRRYVSSNYKDALRSLEAKGKIKADPPMDKRKKFKGVATFGDNVQVTFPARTS